ncbi:MULTISPECIES: hypothetical protein [Chromobacterium]|uniref:Uncharacterized protein n=2 Tax=Chromobacterium TaxID=535 RepID=A0ABS3GG60_9NEIS|nr:MULTISPECIES: hypothetical protein [Chromobacterium]AXT48544.1 hypothetical protein D1345_21295 [Chromobacterium rhizoryzae]MBK0412924.1 hypothetical protein [Chromobacterium haemolyticum]MBO0414026.1 hypothetical protein [Chromobacterium haemolyticum]MBO0497286.1 hypothetical protein [Chromobacterium haemolyticum]MDH0341897.1 hypothetical protein [Chromobacterium haemolyticum]
MLGVSEGEDVEPGSRRRQLAQFLRHERRCWRRLAYWLQQFRSDRPPLRCYAWRPAPEDVDDAASKR